MSDIRTSELVMNKLSKQQYESIQNPSDTELYLVPEDEEHKPICYPTTADNVGTTTMDLKSSVSDNGLKLTEVGFVYSDSNQSPTVSDTKVVCELNNGQFETKLTGLAENTQYHIRSYAINSSGLSYGDELVQNTLLNPIPSTYQLVEYLLGNGTTAYIDTGITISLTNIWELKFRNINVSNNDINGCGEANNARRFIIQYNNGNLIISLGTSYTSYIYKDSNIHIVKLSAIEDAVYYDGYKINVFTGTFAGSNNTLFILGRNQNSSTRQYSSMQVINSKIYDNDSLIQDLYPVYRISDNKPGMYDIVNGVFYTNQGTGEFTVGPDAVWNE